MILFYGAEAIGKLKIADAGENWTTGKFCPFAAFASLKQLFARLETAWLCEFENYFELQNQVDALDLSVADAGKNFKISDFKIINGGFEYKIKH